MLNFGEKSCFYCNKCGWAFPDEIAKKIIEGQGVYCEKCGAKRYIIRFKVQNEYSQDFQEKLKNLLDFHMSTKAKHRKNLKV